MNPATSYRAEELLKIAEQAEKQAGTEAASTLFARHIDFIQSIRSSLPVKDIEILTTTAPSSKTLDKKIKADISSLQSKMARLIHEVAKTIEEKKYSSTEEAVQNMRISKFKSDQIFSLIVAEKKQHISCLSLKIAIEMFCKLNEQIIEKLDAHQTLPPAEEHNLMLGNAVLVYELTAFVVKFIEDFRVDGIAEIRAIHNAMKEEIANLRNNQNKLVKDAKNKHIEPAVREQVEKNIADRKKIIDILEAEWASYMQTVDSIEKDTHTVTAKLPSIKLIRDNAKAQIDVLAAISIIQIVRTNLLNLETAINQLETIQLASLSPSRLNRLLNINSENHLPSPN